MNVEETEVAVAHDQRVKRWVLIVSIVAAILAISTVLALAWGWNKSQQLVGSGQQLAEIIDEACDDPDVAADLGDACPKAAQVKNEDPAPLPIPGQAGRDGVDGTDGVDGVDGAPGPVGPPGPRGLRGFDGLPGENGADGANGVNGRNGSDGANGQDGINGTNGVAGRGVRSMRLTESGDVIVEYTDGTTQNFGPLIGPRGPEGPAGPQGEPGAPGADGAPGPQGEAGPVGPAGGAVPGDYDCPASQYLTGISVNADGTFAIRCSGDPIPELPGNGNQ